MMIVHLINPADKINKWLSHLAAPKIAMKSTENFKSTHAPGFSTASDFIGGFKTLGFFGSKEIVSL